MKAFYRAICLILCLILLSGSLGVSAAELPLPDIADGLSRLWVNIDLQGNLEELDLSGLADALEDLLEDTKSSDLRDRADEIRDRAEDFGLDLSENQLDQLIDALKDLEQGNRAGLRRQVRAGQRIYKVITSVRNFFRNIKNLFRRGRRLF